MAGIRIIFDTVTFVKARMSLADRVAVGASGTSYTPILHKRMFFLEALGGKVTPWTNFEQLPFTLWRSSPPPTVC